MGKRTYVWNSETQTFDELPCTEPDYADVVKAEKELDERKRKQDDRDAFPGNRI